MDAIWSYAVGAASIEGLTEEHRRVGEVLSLVSDSDPLLSAPLPSFDFSSPPVEPAKLAWDLVTSMKAHSGAGLSANQLGLPYRVFASASIPALVCFNPRIVDYSTETEKLVEGCLSYPGIAVPVVRSKKIRVRYQLVNGEMVSKSLDGIVARVFLHEYDHMEGINFMQRTSRFHRERVENKLRIQKRRQK